MALLEKLPLYKKSDLKYLCKMLIPLTSLKTWHYGSNFCPFHDNRNTPAASLFKDSDGIERLYCYRCTRQYTSYDYIVQVLEENPVKHLLKICTKEDLDTMLKDKVNYYELKTSKIEFSTIEKMLCDIYDYDEALSPAEIQTL